MWLCKDQFVTEGDQRTPLKGRVTNYFGCEGLPVCISQNKGFQHLSTNARFAHF